MYSSLWVTSPPLVEPIVVDDAKSWLRVDNDYDDTLIAGLITAARMQIEAITSRALITQTLLWAMYEEPSTDSVAFYAFGPAIPIAVPYYSTPYFINRPLELPRAPVQEIVSVSTTDGNSISTGLDPTDWELDLGTETARLRLVPYVAWPQRVSVEFVAGYGDGPAAVPAPLITATKLLVAHLYENRGDALMPEVPAAIEYLTHQYRLTLV
jgi:hypothetical protein